MYEDRVILETLCEIENQITYVENTKRIDDLRHLDELLFCLGRLLGTVTSLTPIHLFLTQYWEGLRKSLRLSIQVGKSSKVLWWDIEQFKKDVDKYKYIYTSYNVK